MQKTIIITTLAEYQTKFWLLICQKLIANGHKVLVIAFDDKSGEILSQNNVPNQVVSFEKPNETEAEIDAAFFGFVQKYSIENPSLILSHQRVVFDIKNTFDLKAKFVQYMEKVERIFEENSFSGENAFLLQELGGFLSVSSTYIIARHRGVDNWFAEPSFFKGRLFFTGNTFAAPEISPPKKSDISDEVREYLARTLNQKSIAIPQKDKHHYTSSLNKVFNLKNVNRLMTKLYDQYYCNKYQDFGYIGHHVKSHLRMLINSVRVGRFTQKIDEKQKYLYFPFHVPNDVALTYRAPEYHDQLSLISFICRIMPPEYKLVVKEHPAQLGALSATRLINIKKTYDNLIIADPKTNNFDILNNSAGVITVNSKSGIEAALLKKTVFVLGDAFYAKSNLIEYVPNINKLPKALSQLDENIKFTEDEMYVFFQTVFEQTFKGELYELSPNNIEIFAESLQKQFADELGNKP